MGGRTMTTSFTVNYRNFGHWDVYTDEGRAFRIRGTPGDFIALDERKAPYPATKGFKTVTSCMAFICEELMFEQLVIEYPGSGNNKPIL
jgi:hypothetical protein